MTPVLVVGYHRSSVSLKALAEARRLGERLGAEIRVVHVVEVRDYPIDPDSHDFEEKGQEMIEAQEDTVRSAMADYPGDWSFEVLRGLAVEGLLKVAHRDSAMMIVVGGHGFGWGRFFALGESTLKPLLSRSEIPILVIPEFKSERSKESRPA